MIPDEGTDLPWMFTASQYLGTTEVPGPRSNPTILGWTKWLTGWVRGFFTDDDIPWCALFVNACLGEAGMGGTNSLAARSFTDYGVPLNRPTLGAILVFSRKGGGHVGFYIGERPDAFLVRGGNQRNQVNDTWVKKDRLLAIRWPKPWGVPTVDRRQFFDTSGQPVSTDEA